MYLSISVGCSSSRPGSVNGDRTDQTVCVVLKTGFYVMLSTFQQTENICITFIQCWSNVEDVGPALY